MAKPYPDYEGIKKTSVPCGDEQAPVRPAMDSATTRKYLAEKRAEPPDSSVNAFYVFGPCPNVRR